MDNGWWFEEYWTYITGMDTVQDGLDIGFGHWTYCGGSDDGILWTLDIVDGGWKDIGHRLLGWMDTVQDGLDICCGHWTYCGGSDDGILLALYIWCTMDDSELWTLDIM